MPSELVMSNSKQKTYNRCQRQYYYKYVQRLKPKTKKVQLERGTWLHECLMYHYDGEDWRIPHLKYTKQFNSYFEEVREELGDLPGECSRIMKSYLRHYRDEDSMYKTVDSELDEILELPNGLKFRFIIDHIYEDSNGMLWLRDHKTVKNFLDPDFILMDGQLAKYFWCAQKMGYTPLAGIEFNEIRTKAPTIPPITKTGKISTAKKYDTDYWTFLATIKEHNLDPKPYLPTLRRLRADKERFFRRTRLPMSRPMMKNSMRDMAVTARQILRSEKSNEFPRTVLKSCRYDCDFLDICTVELQGGDASSVIRHGYIRDNTKED